MLEKQIVTKNTKSKMGGEKYTALYARLSRDDGDENESNSITNQRELLGNYAKKNGYMNIKYYIDDGFSGANFNRPDFQRMMTDIESGKIERVIVKDMSRLGRDYLRVGFLTEITFAEKEIHFIAVNDNVNSQNGFDNELMPFKNVFNEWFVRDTSKKIKTALRNKGDSGKPVSNTTPFGYMKDPNDKNRWIVNEETAPIVKLIFQLCIQGYNYGSIADYLTEKGYDNPASYEKKQGKKRYDRVSDVHIWLKTTVSFILKNRCYTGSVVNFKTKKQSYKTKKHSRVDPSEWKVFEDVHEPIVDKETFNLAQNIIQAKRVIKGKYNDINIFAGLLKCKRCGRSLYIKRNNVSRSYDAYICVNYNKHRELLCSKHRINADRLKQLVLNDIKRVTEYVKNYEKQFCEEYSKMSNKEAKKLKLLSQNEILKAKSRIVELDTIITKLYEEKILGKLPEDRFEMLATNYENEKSELMSKCQTLEVNLDTMESDVNNFDSFLKVIKSYTNIEELTTEILNSFIDHIEIGESIGQRKDKIQEISIFYKFIGAVNMPQAN